MVRPRVLAALRLTTSSNLVGCSTGRSPGVAPLRIRSTKLAPRRNMTNRRHQAAVADVFSLFIDRRQLVSGGEVHERGPVRVEKGGRQNVDRLGAPRARRGESGCKLIDARDPQRVQLETGGGTGLLRCLDGV